LPMGVEPAFEGVRSPRRPSVRLSTGAVTSCRVHVRAAARLIARKRGPGGGGDWGNWPGLYPKVGIPSGIFRVARYSAGTGTGPPERLPRPLRVGRRISRRKSIRASSVDLALFASEPFSVGRRTGECHAVVLRSCGGTHRRGLR
jgi:hypothetical protein